VEITLEQLMLGKATRIKEREYFTTEQYVTPFLDRMSKYTDKFEIQVKPADQISLNHDGEVNFENIVYNRVWVEAELPGEYAMEGHTQSISLLYALDTRKPIYKIFKNTVRRACLNMCVFSPDLLQVRELEPETAMEYTFVNQAMELTDNTKAMLTQLSNNYIKRNELYDNLGHWVDNCITSKFNSGFGTVKLAESTAIDAYKQLVIDEKSDYYTPEGDICMFDAYNAFTNIITHDKGRDIVNKYEKIYLVKDILGI
jgi:hypothetical protein